MRVTAELCGTADTLYCVAQLPMSARTPDHLAHRHLAGQTKMYSANMYLHGCNGSAPLQELWQPSGTLKELLRLLVSFVHLLGLAGNLRGHWGTFEEPPGTSGDLQGRLGDL